MAKAKDKVSVNVRVEKELRDRVKFEAFKRGALMRDMLAQCIERGLKSLVQEK